MTPARRGRRFGKRGTSATRAGRRQRSPRQSRPGRRTRSRTGRCDRPGPTRRPPFSHRGRGRPSARPARRSRHRRSVRPGSNPRTSPPRPRDPAGEQGRPFARQARSPGLGSLGLGRAGPRCRCRCPHRGSRAPGWRPGPPQPSPWGKWAASARSARLRPRMTPRPPGPDVFRGWRKDREQAV